MVGDSLVHDVNGARQIGMRGILLARGDRAHGPSDADVPVICSLHELPGLVL
jgi:FMN phosphatase YigB (HAD superfamily)